MAHMEREGRENVERALQFRQTNSRAYTRGQEELQNRLKKLRDQKDVVACVIEDMMRRAELAASRIASVTNINDFLRYFESATGSIDRMYMKMFQVHFLLTAEEAFAGSAHYLRAPMAITYSVPDSMARNGAQSAPLETTERLHSFSAFSRPPSVASLDLSICDDAIGHQPARAIPQQYRSIEELGPQQARALPQQYGSVEGLGHQPPQAARALPQQYRSVEGLGHQAARALPQQYSSVEGLGRQPPQALPQQYGAVQELGPQPARELPQQHGAVQELGPQPARALPQRYRSVEELGHQPARALPQQYGSVEELTYSAARGQRTVLPPSGSPAYSGPGAPSEVEVPRGLGYPVLGPLRAPSLTPVLAEDSGAQALLATPPAALTYGSPGPQQQFGVPPAGTSRGDVPEIRSPTPPGCESPATQFSDALSDLALPPTPGYRSPEGQCTSRGGTWPEIPSSPASPVGDCPVEDWSLTGFGRGARPKTSQPPTLVYVKPRAQYSISLTKHPSPPTPVYESPEAKSVSGPGALPKLPSLPTPRYESTEAQFAAGDGPAELPSPSTLPHTSPGAQLATELKPTTALAGTALAPCTVASLPTGGAHAGRVEVPSCSATPCAEAPEPKAEGVALPPVQSSSSTPQKTAVEAIKDISGRGDACSLLAETDRVNNSCSRPQGEGKPAGRKATVSLNNNCSQPHEEGKPAGRKVIVSVNNCSQPHGEGKPAGRKVTVSVPPGFVASHKQPSCTKTDKKTPSPGNISSQTQPLNTATVGSAKSQSSGSHKCFTIPPADTSIIGSTRKVVVSSYKTPSEFSLQLESSSEVMGGLLKDLGAHYQSTVGDEKFKGTVGMHCVAHYAEDDHWYRAQILEVLPDHAKVLYVDFGNCDRVRLRELRHLAEQFASIPAQAFSCSIKMVGVPAGTKIWASLAVQKFWEMVNTPKTKLEAIIYLRDNTTGRFIVDILAKSEGKPLANVSQDFLRMCKAVAHKSNQVSSCFMDIEGPTAKEPSEGNALAARPAGCEPPPATGTSEQHATPPHTTASGGGAPTVQDGTISLETSASAAAASGMAAETAGAPIPPATAIVATGPPPTSTPAAATKPPTTTRAGRPSGAQKAVPDVAKSAAAMPAARPPPGVPPAELPSEGAMADKRSPPETVPAVPPPLPPLPTVALPPGIPPAKLPSGKTFTFILSVVFSPSDFYGQILADNSTREAMEKMKKQLNQHGSASSAPPPESVTKGSFWVCYFEGDKNYYRVQILDMGTASSGWRARVLYVDYGNRSVVNLKNLRPLPDHLAKPPAWAHRMALAMVNPVRGKWEEDATKVFVAETGFKTILVGEKRGQRQAGLETVTEVILWNKSGETPVNINILLVEKKLAQLRAP